MLFVSVWKNICFAAFAYWDHSEQDIWLIDWLIYWLPACLTDWLIDWLPVWLTDWLMDWLIDWTNNNAVRSSIDC